MCPIPITPRTLFGTLALAALAGTTLAAPAPASPVSQSLRWSNGISDQVNIMPPAQLKGELDQLSTRQDASRVLVTLSQPITPKLRATLQAQGLTLLNSLGSTNYFATLNHDADTAALSRSTLASVSSIKTYQKLHQDLISGIIRPWAVSNQGAVATSVLKDRVNKESILLDEYTKAGVDPVVAVIVMFHKDADYKVHSIRLAKQLSAKVASEIHAINSVVLHMPASRINDLGTDDAVMWAEPPLPLLTPNNANNREFTGVNTLQAAPYNLDGSGVNVLIYDSGQVAAHPDFDGRLAIGDPLTSDTISHHSTHVAGIIGGDGSASINNEQRGMAPAVNLFSYGTQNTDMNGDFIPGFLYTNPIDLHDDYKDAINRFGVDISNNSIGTNIELNGSPCEWTGNYGATSALIDSIVAGSLGSPFRVIWSNGNERHGIDPTVPLCQGNDDNVGGEFFSTAPPACAKNHITVGSVDSFDGNISFFSSWGPTDDGRIKPDICAPGIHKVLYDNLGEFAGFHGVLSTDSVLSTQPDYIELFGTSMAAPVITGISALILQQYRITFPAREDFRNSTLKAILANTAVDGGSVENPGPDYKYGFGIVDAVEAVNAVIDENIFEAEVAQDAVYRFVVNHNGIGDLKVTIAWDDVAAVPNVSPSLVNDLDIRIFKDDFTSVRLPWTLDPSDPDAPAVRTVRDGLNNIEQVVIDALDAGEGAYYIEVTGFNIAQGATQSFGIVANGTLTPSADCPADINGDDALNFLDISAFLVAYGVQHSIADFEQDGAVNFLDVSAFLAAYGAGCS